ncbi:epimerase [Agromyces rhizosphaerae]|uniref:Epimerase n=1 Tax=Agromyces rhizosphaerae TaxID=88374 RepID=A0A9W6CU92_9MICO|nr:TIGR01777 family oxidoreductase [Agromyces rhizosphaerae]GLI25820.1 epimerase [Agromyces rhizosphaerae]
MKVLIAGASGFIGSSLVPLLRDEGHDVVKLVRRKPRADDELSWSPGSGIIDFTVMDRVDAVIDFSGANLARLPWTPGYRREILDSRIEATRTLTDAMRQARTPPAVFLNASASGVYGDRPAELLTEESPPGDGFLAGVVTRWEDQARLAPEETRTVMFRSGIVMGDGGAMQRLSLLTRFGLGARLGTGGQHWPWISLLDEVRAIRHLLVESKLSGPVNLAGPTPATCDRIAHALAERMRRPYAFTIPEPVLGTMLGQAADEMLLASAKVVPSRLLGDGFEFVHTTAEAAIDAMLSGEPTRVPA